MATAEPLTGDMKYEETESLLNEVVHLFSDKSDVVAVRESNKMIADLHATQEARHQEIVESIRGLTAQLQRAKQDHVERKSTVLDETQRQQLLAERSRVDENIRRLALVRVCFFIFERARDRSLPVPCLSTRPPLTPFRPPFSQESDGLKESISACDKQAAQLSAREQQLRQQESVEVPRARHTISLYANISSIRWDFSSPAIKGWITSSSGAGMKAFEMDANHRHTEFAVTNYLWELMDAC